MKLHDHRERTATAFLKAINAFSGVAFILALFGCSGGGGSSSSSGSSGSNQLSVSGYSKGWIGWCQPVTISVLSSSGSATTLSTSLDVNYSSTTGSIYSDSSCSTSTSSQTVTSGTASWTVYFKPSTVSTNCKVTATSTLGTFSYTGTCEAPAMTSVRGQTGFTTGTANALAVQSGGLNEPRRATIVGSTLYIADTQNNRVLKFPSLSATSPTGVLGQPDLLTTTDNSSPTGGLFSNPVSVWSDGTRLLVTLRSQNRVFLWNNIPSSDGAAPDVIIGQSVDTTTTSGSSLNQLSLPEHAFIMNNKLLVLDGGNNRVLVFNTVPSSHGATADVVIGNGGGNGPDQLSAPLFADSVQIGSSTKLIIADSGNHRLQIFDSIPTSSFASADTTFTMSNVSGNPTSFLYHQSHFLIYDANKSEILFWNSFPTTGTSADGVIGQADLSSVSSTIDSSTLGQGYGMLIMSSALWVFDSERNRFVNYIFPGS